MLRVEDEAAAADRYPVADETDPVVVARGLVKRYRDRTVVNAVDLTVARGECFGLLGPNGAGKTTTLRMLMGFTPPNGGELTVLGHRIPAQARAMRRLAGVVPQFDNLDPDFSVRENLSTYASYFGLGARRIQRRIDDLLRFAALEHRAGAGIHELSGGMKRRLTLARALINDPELLVLDEPTTGLDPQARQHIWERLRGLLEEGRTLILTTHYMEEAERLCDRIAIMDRGGVVACDTPAGLIAAHIEPHVAELRGRPPEELVSAFRGQANFRLEEVGDTLFVYAREREPLLEHLSHLAGRRYIYRPAHLEDVFLKLTGRDLRD